MPRKPKLEVQVVCSQCGHKPEGNKQGDWIKYPTTCSKCGGQVRPTVLGGE